MDDIAHSTLDDGWYVVPLGGLPDSSLSTFPSRACCVAVPMGFPIFDGGSMGTRHFQTPNETPWDIGMEGFAVGVVFDGDGTISSSRS